MDAIIVKYFLIHKLKQQKQSKAKVAILLAAYNGMKYLDKQVSSILDQQNTDITLYINIDKSEDGTEEHIGKLADKNKNIWTDCQAVMHKPITETTSRTPHIDNPMEMWAGLLYMPYKNDESVGGEFQLHKVKNKISKVNMSKGRQVFDEDLGPVVKTVPYKRNTFVMFANNSPNTVHSVSMRISPTAYRRSVNIIGEFKRGYAKMYEVQEIR